MKLTVTDEVESLKNDPPKGGTRPPGATRSPSGFTPGRWHNPDLEGHGWSFFWNSRLLLDPSHPLYGEGWDLFGLWYTYEARTKYEQTPGTCPGPSCVWVYQDYRPVFARMWLTRVSSQRYQGSVYITRSNVQYNVGSLSVEFGTDASTAVLDWGANFLWQYLTGSEQIELLVAPDEDPVDNPAHYSGLWQPADEEFLVSDALGWTSESVEVVFEDEDGQPSWIMAAGDDPVPGHTDLCFFYVAQGFAPGTTGNLGFYEDGCDADLPAGPANRNGYRLFTAFEEENFWVNFDLPGGTAPDEFAAGSPSNPDDLTKLAGLNRIEFDATSGPSCELSSSSPQCPLSLTWFSGGNFPETSAFALNTSSGERILIRSDTVMEAFEYCIDQPGQWLFELRMGDTPDSSLMGVSDVFSVTGAGTSACSSASPETPPPPASAPDMTPSPSSSGTGATPGDFAVSPSGAATYRIPIFTAPGSGGLAPSLALAYDSQAGNGPAGVGWGIDGYSVISRCAQTIEQDAATRAGRISFSQEDRFCLDGERLMAVSGSYGAHGTEYRKERDDFTRVVSYGASGNGPEFFIAWSREGDMLEFGRTADSRIETQSSGIENVALAWAQDRFEDTAGNYILFEYSENQEGAADFVLDTVRYTGNTVVATQPYAEIRFIYGDRPDHQTAFVAGAAVAQSRRLGRIDSLSRIEAGAPLQFLRSYQLHYGVDGWGRSTLESVSECRDTSLANCFRPTNFDWLKSEHSISSSGPDVSSLFTSDFRGLALADANGDGRSDLLITERDGNAFEFGIATGSASGAFTPGPKHFELPAGEQADRPVALTVIDLNADGYQDVLFTRQTGSEVQWHARLAGPDGVGGEFIVLDDCCNLLSPALLQVLDFNGDGLSDVMTNRPAQIFQEASEIVVLINDFKPGDLQPSFRPPLAINVNYPDLFPASTQNGWALADEAPIFGFQSGRHLPGRVDDFHGDGSADILVRLSRRYQRCIGQPCRPNTPADPGGTSESVFVIPDQDEPIELRQPSPQPFVESAYVTFYLVLYADEGGEYSTYEVIAKGAGEECDVPDICNPYFTLPSVKRTQPVDINADGLRDVAYLDENYDWYFLLNTGSGFLQPNLISSLSDDGRAALARFVDINGDGFPELLYPSRVESDNAIWMVQYNDLGNGFSSPQTSSMPAGNTRQGDGSVMLDFTGDGLIDQLFIDWRADGNGTQSGTTRLRRGVNLLTGNSGEPSNVVASIVNGFGHRTDVGYGALTDPDVHSRMNDSANTNWGRGSAVYDLSVPFYVVSSVETSAPVFGNPDETARRLYHYAGAKLQAGGRGFLGFAEVVEYDQENGLRTNTRYRQDFPFSGLIADRSLFHSNFTDQFDLITDISDEQPLSWPSVTATTPVPAHQAGGILIRNSIHEWNAVETTPSAGTWAVRSAAVLSREFSLEGAFKSKTWTTRSFDSFGNVGSGQETLFALDGAAPWSIVTTENQWINDLARWRLGQLAATQVTQWRANTGPSIVRETSFGYDPESSLLVRETAEPGHPSSQVVTDYALDDFGNRTTTSVTGAGMMPRISSSGYDSLGRFAVESRNAYDQVVLRVDEWDVFGNPIDVSNIDNVSTISAADHMGRLFVSYTGTGSWTRTDLGPGGHAQCPTGTSSHAVTTAGGAPTSITCFDKVGRTVRKATQGFLGGWILLDNYFDGSGRPERVSEPYFSGQARFWNLTAYDVLGRPTQTTAANGLQEQVFYDVLATHCGQSGPRAVLRRTLPADGTTRESMETRNPAGETERVIDGACGVVAYSYDAVGNLVQTIGIDGSITSIGYDGLGLHKVFVDDPDKGLWEYASNALGEVTRQLDGKDQAIDFEYDLMGRVIHRRELTEVSSLSDSSFHTENHEITAWQNSTSGSVSGRGQLITEQYRQGEAGAVLHGRSYTYDQFGRLQGIDHDLEGQVFSEFNTYDQFGRLFQQFDASGESNGTRYHYNDYGYMEKLQEARQGEAGVVYQQILAVDPRGRPSAVVLGNGSEMFAEYDAASGLLRTLEAYGAGGEEMQHVEYGFDSLGNLQYRHDLSGDNDLREDYEYDGLSRLERVMLSAPSLGLDHYQTQSTTYDGSGNITYKSGVGAYSYGQGTAGPHAVTGAGNLSYAYDANGNQVSSSDGRVITYSAFDKPTRLEKGSEFTEFSYGLGNQRYKRVDGNQIAPQKTTWTVGNVELIESGGSAPYFKRYLGGVAIVDYYPSTGNGESWYFARDRLGSVHTFSNAAGEKVLQSHFDPWGLRQGPDWQTPLSESGAVYANQFTTRGFTGHEHADGVGIIHMNGRIYDPRLGLFLQADPFVQAPRNGQSLNRYTYALNNPLSYTDPSGYFFKGFFQRWGRIIVAAVASYFTFGVTYGAAASALATGVNSSFAFAQFIHAVGWQAVAGVAAGAASGLVAGAIASGSLRGAVKTAFVGAITWGISKYFGNTYNLRRVAAESLAGGVNARILGGRFEDGLRFSLAVSGLNYANFRMRASERMLSQRHPRGSNTDGVSSGLYGDQTKLGGARETLGPEGQRLPCRSLAGGCQGAPVPDSLDQRSSLLGYEYPPGGVLDKLVEYFAGPHDYLRDHISRSYHLQTSGFEIAGNSKYFSGLRASIDQFANFALIPLASPFAVGALLSTQPTLYVISMLEQYQK